MEFINSDVIEEIAGKTVLHWNYRGLLKLPHELENHGDSIQELYLKENQIVELPRWISKMSSLTNLYLSDNQLKEFPGEICEIRQLKVLDLSRNYLKTLPESIEDLRNLTQLVVDQNCLTHLPSGLSELENLTCLSLSRNNIVILPDWLGSMKRLEKLLVDNNFLEEVPNRLTLLPTLREISICSNRLKFLPLNSFVSSANIYFSCNPCLNYLSYPMLSQLLDLGWDDGKHCFSINSSFKSKLSSINMKLLVKFNEASNEKSTLIELPRQLMRIYKNNYNEPPSLWELSLRSLYQSDYEYSRQKPDIFHKILMNGPISVCLNMKCQQPIFTEAWLIVGTTEETALLIVALFCSQRCMCNFDSESYGIEDLSWEIYHGS